MEFTVEDKYLIKCSLIMKSMKQAVFLRHDMCRKKTVCFIIHQRRHFYQLRHVKVSFKLVHVF